MASSQVGRRASTLGRYVQPLVDVQEGLDVAESVVDDADHRKYLFSNPSHRIALAPKSIIQRLLR